MSFMKVIVAFAVAAVLAVIAGGFGFFWEGQEYHSRDLRQVKSTSLHMPSLTTYRKNYARRRRETVDALLVSFGDTQIVTSIALLATANFAMGCNISAYHISLVCKLALVASASHVASMSFMHRYFDKNWKLSISRLALILVSFIFAAILFGRRSSIFPSATPNSDATTTNGTTNTGLVLPASCFVYHPGQNFTTSYNNFTSSLYWNHDFTTTVMNTSSVMANGTHNSGLRRNGTTMPNFEPFSSSDNLGNSDLIAYVVVSIAMVITAGVSVLLHFWQDSQELEIRHGVALYLRGGSFLTAVCVMIYGAYQFWDLWMWMQKSKWFGDGDDESDIHSFGQFMPIVLLVLPNLAVVEQAVGKSDPPLPTLYFANIVRFIGQKGWAENQQTKTNDEGNYD